jgi:hypothetical protein
MIIPGSLQYIYGYRYNPNIANEFNYDLAEIRENLTDEIFIVGDKYDFYQILQDSMEVRVAKTAEEGIKLAAEPKSNSESPNSENNSESANQDNTNSENTNSDNTKRLAFLGHPEKAPDNYILSRIVTSPMRENSDIIYIYTKSGAPAP